MKNRFKLLISESFLVSFVLLNSVISSKASGVTSPYPFDQPLDGMIAAPSPWDIIKSLLLPFSLVVGFITLIIVLIKRYSTKKPINGRGKKKK